MPFLTVHEPANIHFWEMQIIAVDKGAGLRNTRFLNVAVFLSPKWADFGKWEKNGGICGKFSKLDGKMENFGDDTVNRF